LGRPLSGSDSPIPPDPPSYDGSLQLDKAGTAKIWLIHEGPIGARWRAFPLKRDVLSSPLQAI